MASEEFTTNVVGDIPDILYAIYTRVLASGVMRIAVESGVTLVNNGTVFGTPADASFFSADGSYIVLEPVTGYASGSGRWQVQLKHDLVATTLQYNGCLQNTFDSATETFIPDLSTGLLSIVTVAIDLNSTLYLAMSDSEYAYFKAIIVRNNGSTQFGFYAGGYTPFTANDTRPICFLAGGSFTGDTATFWGRMVADGSNHNRTQVEYAQTTRPSGAGYAALRQIEEVRTVAYLTYDGINVGVPLTLFALPNNILGAFGPLNMVGSNISIPDGTADSAHSLLHLGGIAHRWVT